MTGPPAVFSPTLDKSIRWPRLHASWSQHQREPSDLHFRKRNSIDARASAPAVFWQRSWTNGIDHELHGALDTHRGARASLDAGDRSAVTLAARTIDALW